MSKKDNQDEKKDGPRTDVAPQIENTTDATSSIGMTSWNIPSITFYNMISSIWGAADVQTKTLIISVEGGRTPRMSYELVLVYLLYPIPNQYQYYTCKAAIRNKEITENMYFEEYKTS